MPTIHTHPSSVPDHVWDIIAVATTAEPKIDSTRNTPENLKDLYENFLAVVLMKDDEPIGFIAAWPVEDGFVEIGSIWIREDYRSKGHSHKLYKAVAGLSGIKGLITFGVTSNAISVRAGKRVGLTIVEDWSNPVPMHLTCGVCELVAPAEQPTCTKRGISCWFRIMMPG